MSNIIDTIRVSGTDYTLSATSSGGNPTVELTQAEYDALVSAGTVQQDTYYIITDAQAGDLTQYWTSAQTNSAITQATSGKVDNDTYTAYTAATDATLANKQTTLTAGTGIDITDNVISATGGGGGGKAIEAGRGIDVTTGTTADTVSFNLPMSADTIGLAFFDSKDGGEISSGNSINKNNLVLSGLYNKIGGNGSKRVFSGNFISGWSSKIYDNTWAYDYGATYNIIFGSYNTLSGNGKSVHSSIIVGDYCYGYDKNQSLFGLYLQAQNNSEHSIGQNNVSNKASSTFGDSGNTLFSVGNGTEENARHNAFEIRQNGDIYLSSGGTDIKLQDHLGGGGASYSAGTGIDITNDVISVSGVVMSSAITTSVTSSSTDAQVPSAKAVNDKLGGLSLVKLTQAQYDALATKDSNTLYVIVN